MPAFLLQGVETLEVVEVALWIERVSGAAEVVEAVEVVEVADVRSHVHGVRNVVSPTPRNAITQVACLDTPSGFNHQKTRVKIYKKFFNFIKKQKLLYAPFVFFYFESALPSEIT